MCTCRRFNGIIDGIDCDICERKLIFLPLWLVAARFNKLSQFKFSNKVPTSTATINFSKYRITGTGCGIAAIVIKASKFNYVH